MVVLVTCKNEEDQIKTKELAAMCSCLNIAKFKMLLICKKKNFFSELNFFVHIFNMLVTYLQSI